MDTFEITQAIGNTPLVKLKNVVPPTCADIYVKLEYLNPTGSFKDRMALAIIEEAEKRGSLKPGMTVIECTAGGTGTAMAFVCSVKGYSFKVVSSDAFAKEKLQAMRVFGADLDLLASDNGKITPDLIPRMIEHTKEISKQQGYYWTQQFENKDALVGYQRMGNEIMKQLGKPVDIFCSAVGTAGMFTGVNSVLRKAHSKMKSIIIEPVSAPLLSKGLKGSHTIDGISVGFVPPLLKETKYDDVEMFEESEARAMAKILVAREGIFAGTSTGLNVVAAIALGKKLGPNHTIVTVACDAGMKYLSGPLFN